MWRVFFFFFFAVVCGCDGFGWWWRWWVVVVWVGGCGGRQCWVEKERDKGERERERIKNEYLNEMLKKIEVLV